MSNRSRPVGIVARIPRIEPLEYRQLLAVLAMYTGDWSEAPANGRQNLIDDLENDGHTVHTFTDNSATGFTNALNGTDALVLQLASDAFGDSVITQSAQQVIRNYLQNGGGLVMVGGTGSDSRSATAFLNKTFQFATVGMWYGWVAESPRQSAAVGTAFEGGPADLEAFWGNVAAIKIETLPAGSRVIYRSDMEAEGATQSSATVAVLPYAGRLPIVTVAWQWRNGGPNGSLGEFDWSPVLQRAVTQVARTTLPATPTSITATAVSASQINLAWQDNAGNELGYVIERATSSGGPFSEVATLSANSQSYTDGGLNRATTYHYRVRAANAAGYSTAAVVVNAATFSAPAFVSDGLLRVDGTAQDDTILIRRVGSQIEVELDGIQEIFKFNLNTVNLINVFCGDGNDYVSIDSSVAVDAYVTGGPGDDTLRGGSGNDSLTGGSGRNRLFGGDGGDRLNGSNGRDFLYGEGGDDRLYGQGGNDVLDGGGNKDRLYGGDGDDLIQGGTGNDQMYGHAGSDTLIGGRGNDRLDGGDGFDRIIGRDAGDILIDIESIE